ncbi:MAG: aminotransferase class IV [Bacteroidales bacterium]|nr:aminotransferase class IV [Bacteroidales bacterium]
MCLLVETIKIAGNEIYNLEFHNSRFNTSRQKLFKQHNFINLADLIKIPDTTEKGVILKCRVLYDQKIQKIEYLPYERKIINSLKIVEDNTIQYAYKYADRDYIKKLYEERGDCDDILIVKGHFISDTSFCNIVFYDGNKWITPSTPLLKGTKRSMLLKTGKISEDELKLSDINKFRYCSLINAFLDLDEIRIDCYNIF